jgi:hypothetical protein
MQKDDVCNFTIEPSLAKAIRDDYERQIKLFRKEVGPSENGGPPSASELEEKLMLEARIADRASKISCPPGYGVKEYVADSGRIRDLSYKRSWPSSCGTLNEADDAEEAQLRARIVVYEGSPEGRGRQRIFGLSLKSFAPGLSAAEQNEYDSLKLLYPDPPPDPNDPLKDARAACKAVVEKCKEEERKSQQDRLERIRTLRRRAED